MRYSCHGAERQIMDIGTAEFPVTYVIYHKHCSDGFGAAFVVSQKYPKAKYVPIAYGETLNEDDLIGHNVLMVDFSFPRAQMLRIHELANTLLVLDHHKTAEVELAGLDFCVFDMNRSGIKLAWDWCFPTIPRPWYVEYIEDRDLWRWKLQESQEVSAYLGTLPYTFEAWSTLHSISFVDVCRLGRAVRSHIDHYVAKVCEQAYTGTWDDHRVSIVNAAYPNISEVCNRLCRNGAEIGIGWFIRADGLVQFSLRSIGDLDVSVYAKLHGGGGHRNAAGFELPQQKAQEFLSLITSIGKCPTIHLGLA
jgi:oligoribonuclease NrnB/cAMP/cGMP phosphodiesterase (DHH superfamily)